MTDDMRGMNMGVCMKCKYYQWIYDREQSKYIHICWLPERDKIGQGQFVNPTDSCNEWRAKE